MSPRPLTFSSRLVHPLQCLRVRVIAYHLFVTFWFASVLLRDGVRIFEYLDVLEEWTFSSFACSVLSPLRVASAQQSSADSGETVWTRLNVLSMLRGHFSGRNEKAIVFEAVESPERVLLFAVMSLEFRCTRLVSI